MFDVVLTLLPIFITKMGEKTSHLSVFNVYLEHRYQHISVHQQPLRTPCSVAVARQRLWGVWFLRHVLNGLGMKLISSLFEHNTFS